MAFRGSISRALMSTAARSSTFRSSPLVPRILPTPMSTAQSLLPLAGARMTSHLIVNVRAFCKLSQDTSNVSSTVNDPIDSKTTETSQTLNDEIKEKGADDCSDDEDPEVVKSSKKKKKSGDGYPQFDLNDYPLARDEDRQIMKMINEYNRRNRDIIAKKKPMEDGERVSDEQLENLGDLLKSVCQMVGADDVKKKTHDVENNNKNNSPHGN